MAFCDCLRKFLPVLRHLLEQLCGRPQSCAVQHGCAGGNDPRTKSRIFRIRILKQKIPNEFKKAKEKKKGRFLASSKKEGKKREVPREIERAARTCREILRISRL